MDKEKVFTLNCINLKLLMRIGPTSHCCVFPEQKNFLGHLTMQFHFSGYIDDYNNYGVPTIIYHLLLPFLVSKDRKYVHLFDTSCFSQFEKYDLCFKMSSSSSLNPKTHR